VPPAYATEEVIFHGYPARALHSREAALTAVFTPQIGMLGCSLEHQGDELLGHRGGIARYEATGSTMGIPLLHPWANRLAGLSYTAAGRTVKIDPDSPAVRTDPNGLPIHGLVNTSPHWELAGAHADETSARLSATLAFGAHPELLEAFPFPHSLAIDAAVHDATLTIRTTLTATGDSPVPVSFGYHPYFQLPDVARADWHLQLPAMRRLVLDERMIPTGETEAAEAYDGPLGEREYDDAYEGVGDGTRFVLAGGGRRIAVELVDGYRYAVVYAPAGEDLIALEPMTAPTNALVSGNGLELVPPGGTRSATFAVAVEPQPA
jgi:galactose mutarotase-like enzyme